MDLYWKEIDCDSDWVSCGQHHVFYSNMAICQETEEWDMSYVCYYQWVKCLFTMQVRANDIDGGVEDGYESSKDENASVSSFNMKDPIHKSFGSSLSLQSVATQSSVNDRSYFERGGRSSFSSHMEPPHLSVAEVLQDASAGILNFLNGFL